MAVISYTFYDAAKTIIGRGQSPEIESESNGRRLFSSRDSFMNEALGAYVSAIRNPNIDDLSITSVGVGPRFISDVDSIKDYFLNGGATLGLAGNITPETRRQLSNRFSLPVEEYAALALAGSD